MAGLRSSFPKPSWRSTRQSSKLLRSVEVEAALRRERMVFAAKVRGARAILGWSQRDLGRRVSLTQKSVCKVNRELTVCGARPSRP